jgi:hypothetical protein
MRDWTALSEEERSEIESKLVAALNSIGIKGAVTRWNVPSQLPHWQLVIETSWCDKQPRSDILIARDQAMARADIQGPMNGVILKSPPDQWQK